MTLRDWPPPPPAKPLGASFRLSVDDEFPIDVDTGEMFGDLTGSFDGALASGGGVMVRKLEGGTSSANKTACVR